MIIAKNAHTPECFPDRLRTQLILSQPRLFLPEIVRHPFGTLYGMPTLVDREVAKSPEIVFNAGTHTSAVRMMYADYAKLVQPRVLDVAIHEGQFAM